VGSNPSPRARPVRTAAPVAGILLTGGASRRMGKDKATLVIESRPLAQTVRRRLEASVDFVVEVGDGTSGAAVSVRESPAGAGPLAALLAGVEAAATRGHHGSVLLLACDLPLVSVSLLRWLARFPGNGSVLPVVGSRPQPLCARWSPADLAAGGQAYQRGERSLRPLVECPDVQRVGEGSWGAVASPRCFADVDSVDDLRRLGLRWQPAPDTCSGTDREMPRQR